MGTNGPLGSRGEIGLLRGPSAQLAYLLRDEDVSKIISAYRIYAEFHEIWKISSVNEKKKRKVKQGRERGGMMMGGFDGTFMSDLMAASHVCVPKVPDISRSSALSLLSSSPTSALCLIATPS